LEGWHITVLCGGNEIDSIELNEEDFVPQKPKKLISDSERAVMTQPIMIEINVQPEVFQIANYNIYPTITIYFAVKGTDPIQLSVVLVDCSTNLELSEGFQSNGTYSLPSKGNCIHLTGLKLNRMGSLKKQLSLKTLKNLDFKIRFTAADLQWESNSFKIVSNCAQLPLEIREHVRPAKRM